MTKTGLEALCASFFEECDELLEAMQDGFDQLAVDPDDEETLNAVFRAAHSIKGGAGAFGFDAVVDFAHAFESALDRVRGHLCEVDPARLDIFRQCCDRLTDLVAAAREGGDVAGDETQQLLERLNEAVGGEAAAPEITPDFEPVTLDLTAGGTDEADGVRTRYDIRFRAEPALFASGNEPLALFRALADLGQLEVCADLSAVPPLAELAPRECLIAWHLTLISDADEAKLREVFEFVEADCALAIDAHPAATADALAVTSQDLTGPEDDPGAIPALSEMVAAPPAADRPAETQPVPGPPPRGAERDRSSERKTSGRTIRVDLERIDRLINLVGELVIKEAMLSQSVIARMPGSQGDVSEMLEGLRQLAGEIQEGVMAIRAQPVKPVFQRMARTLREASAATGKRVRLVTDGEYTEVDKTVLERLIDPLTHMIRNAVDHGLEPAEIRIEAGKPEEGTVMLSAAHRSGRILIDVVDDGCGIDREAVRKRAVERGLVPPEATLSVSEIDNLLFLPGFSSKDAVSELSGRGVGLDVVRSAIQALGGRITIQSDPGEGTTFSISLPLTLAVLEGMLIEVSGQIMVVPISAIRETLQPASATVDMVGADTRVLRSRDGIVPVIDLGAVFGFRPSCSKLEGRVLLLIESDNNQRYALVVDDIRDQRQVVIKSLETNYQQIPGVAAATILGDGRIALIVDPDTILGVPGLPGHDDPFLQLAV